tara:strand:- start:73 stop:696 length:624 start_codon:yes stop_codon:yes gene_type:complete
MNTNKVRDRTPEELSVKKNEFLKICDILDQLKIKYFLQTGILLGAIREQNFVKWDWGVDISVFSYELFNKIDVLEEALIKNGFKILSVNKKKEDLKIFFRGQYPLEVTGYTVFGWNYSKIKEIYWRTDYSVPSKYLNNFSRVELFGRKFNCPNPPEEYLTYAYGDWKKPLRSSDKNLYNAGIYYKKRNYFFKTVKKIKNKIYSIFKS